MGGRQVGSGSSLSDVPAWFQHMGTRGALSLPDFGQHPDTLVPTICGICGYTILIHLSILSLEEFEDPEMRRGLREAGYTLDDTTA